MNMSEDKKIDGTVACDGCDEYWFIPSRKRDYWGNIINKNTPLCINNTSLNGNDNTPSNLTDFYNMQIYGLASTVLVMARMMNLECGWINDKDDLSYNYLWVIYKGELYGKYIASSFTLDPRLRLVVPNGYMNRSLPTKTMDVLWLDLLKENSEKDKGE